MEWVNGVLFAFFYKSKLEMVLPIVFSEAATGRFAYRKLGIEDIRSLFDLIAEQTLSDLKYFSPHKFELTSLETQFKKPAFLMMGAFEKEKLAGYFFLRFFANRKCFVGRLIDKDYRGKGVGATMNFIMYETAWQMGFRCLSTISRNNISVMRAHSKNPDMIILKDLSDDYILVEFVRRKK